MNSMIATYSAWVDATLETLRSSPPSLCAAVPLLLSAENAHLFARTALAGAVDDGDRQPLCKLYERSRYLAVFLGSSVFDVESESELALLDEPLDSSLFDVGLGWLPLAIMLGCDLSASIDNASHARRFSCYISDINYNFSLNSASAMILTLDDIKLVSVRQIAQHSKCSEEDLVDYLNKVSVSEWDYAIADSGDSLLIAEGY